MCISARPRRQLVSDDGVKGDQQLYKSGSTRVAMGNQQARIRDEGVCLKGPAAVAKLLNCRYQHNTSAGVDRERQLLDRTITRIRRTLTSRTSKRADDSPRAM
ncbi:hypothetical protein G5I_11843 [Acromyrmex echinatior]|uniref:Uncharacterized protein n=1 Tax=Acromyrmex echinatior TaxID=103372 RepID=F4X0R0_ACREC|nr:hypothetical protein G5I_11843 [Acromyrmex echinatior]